MADRWFGDQDEAVQLLDRHRAELVAQAREVLAQQPGTRWVGIVITGDTEEAAEVRRQLASEGAPPPGGAGIVMLMPREWGVQLLRTASPRHLDWLDSDAGRLPLICVTRGGTRVASAPLATA